MSQPPDGARDFEPLETGDYTGTVEKAEVTTNQQGQKLIKVQLRLNNKRVVFDRLNFEAQNPTAKKIALEKFQSICYYGVNKPQSKFATIDQMAAYIRGVPVHIHYKNKGKDESGKYDRADVYYKPCAEKATKAAPAAGSLY